jgi:hypothetical protein
LNQSNRQADESPRVGRGDSPAQEGQEADPELEPLSYFGTDFDVEGLVRRVDRGDIVVARFGPLHDSPRGAAGFQRAFIWKKAQMDRFIESLLLGFPIPGIFLVQQEDNSYLVLDGQQRLMTLELFYSDKFALENVTDELRDLSYRTLTEEQRRTLDTTFIHATIVRYNPSQAGNESVYTLFERLNTGGTVLDPQEIRVALYHGPLIELLEELDEFPEWREIYGPPSTRLRDQELILRFLAFYLDVNSYRRPLKAFLNRFLAYHRDLQDLNAERLSLIFRSTCVTANRALGRSTLRPGTQINAAFADAILVGLARRLEAAPITDLAAVSSAREALLKNPEFLNAIRSATASEERVFKRLQIASEVFRALP